LDEIIRSKYFSDFQTIGLIYILDEDKEEIPQDVAAKYNFELLKTRFRGHTQPATSVWREIQSQLLTTRTG
jgi:hypothetical protein